MVALGEKQYLWLGRTWIPAESQYCTNGLGIWQSYEFGEHVR